MSNLWRVVSAADPVESVKFDHLGVTVCLGADSYCVPWTDIRSISVQGIGNSFDPKKMHYILELADRELRVSVATPGMNDFVSRLQTVPGVDRFAYIRALQDHGDEPMVIWRNPEELSTTGRTLPPVVGASGVQ